MGGQQSKAGQPNASCAFSAKELYNLKQVYFFLCLHTTTLTSCPLDRNQFHSLFKNHRQYKPLWRALFTAIDVNCDNVIDFEEFLGFVTALKRGEPEARRSLVFRLFDADCDGKVELSDLRCVSQTRAISLRRPAWAQGTITALQQLEGEGAEDEYAQFFSACDEDEDGRISYDDLEGYCMLHGDTVVAQTLKLLEAMFDGVIEETGIIITATDVKNTKPHIDWQDNKIGMGSIFCCSNTPPVFTSPPVA